MVKITDYPEIDKNISEVFCKDCLVKACCSIACDEFIDHMSDETGVNVNDISPKQFSDHCITPQETINICRIMKHSVSYWANVGSEIKKNAINGAIARLKERGLI